MSGREGKVAVVTGAPEGIGAGIVSRTSLGRAAEPDDITPVVAFTASDDARFVTGETVLARAGLQWEGQEP